ncbi:MAG: hypothetical protein CME60_00195 [Halobacteriovoraceae bacterium]|nr:hypothetical protein [Halobacteriovoraceae bacterium]
MLGNLPHMLRPILFVIYMHILLPHRQNQNKQAELQPSLRLRAKDSILVAEKINNPHNPFRNSSQSHYEDMPDIPFDTGFD